VVAPTAVRHEGKEIGGQYRSSRCEPSYLTPAGEASDKKYRCMRPSSVSSG
jgi:hypothetical protein